MIRRVARTQTRTLVESNDYHSASASASATKSRLESSSPAVTVGLGPLLRGYGGVERAEDDEEDGAAQSLNVSAEEDGDARTEQVRKLRRTMEWCKELPGSVSLGCSLDSLAADSADTLAENSANFLAANSANCSPVRPRRRDGASTGMCEVGESRTIRGGLRLETLRARYGYGYARREMGVKMDGARGRTAQLRLAAALLAITSNLSFGSLISGRARGSGSCSSSGAHHLRLVQRRQFANSVSALPSFTHLHARASREREARLADLGWVGLEEYVGRVRRRVVPGPGMRRAKQAGGGAVEERWVWITHSVYSPGARLYRALGAALGASGEAVSGVGGVAPQTLAVASTQVPNREEGLPENAVAQLRGEDEERQLRLADGLSSVRARIRNGAGGVHLAPLQILAPAPMPAPAAARVPVPVAVAAPPSTSSAIWQATELSTSAGTTAWPSSPGFPAIHAVPLSPTVSSSSSSSLSSSSRPGLASPSSTGSGHSESEGASESGDSDISNDAFALSPIGSLSYAPAAIPSSTFAGRRSSEADANMDMSMSACASNPSASAKAKRAWAAGLACLTERERDAIDCFFGRSEGMAGGSGSGEVGGAVSEFFPFIFVLFIPPI